MYTSQLVRKAQVRAVVSVVILLVVAIGLAAAAGHTEGIAKALLIGGAFAVLPPGMYPITLFAERARTGMPPARSPFPGWLCAALDKLKLPTR